MRFLNSKKFIAAVLSAAMTLSVVPAFAEAETKVATSDITSDVVETISPDNVWDVDIPLVGTEFGDSVDLLESYNSTKALIKPTGNGYSFDYATKTLYISDASSFSTSTSGSQFKYGWYACAVDTTNPDRVDTSLTKLSDTIVRICSITEHIVIESGVTTIGNFVFRDFKTNFPNIESFSLPNTLTKIGEEAFSEVDFVALGTDMDSFSNITEIGDFGFIDCTFGDVNFKKLIRCSGDEGYIFSGATFDSLTFSENLTSLGQGALKDATIRNGVLKVPSSLKSTQMYFCANANISDVYLGAGITSIDWHSFSGTKIKNLYIENPNLKVPASSSQPSAFTSNGTLTDIYFYGTKEERESNNSLKTGANNHIPETAIWHYTREIIVEPIPDQYYFGNPVKPQVTVKDRNILTGVEQKMSVGTDYTVSYDNNEGIGVGTAYVKCIGDYTNCGTISADFNIVEFDPTKAPQGPISLDDVVFEISDANFFWGHPNWPYVIEPTIYATYTYTVNGETIVYPLSDYSDYTVSYENNENVGTAIVTITGKGEFEGTYDDYFSINPFNLEVVQDTSTYYLVTLTSDDLDLDIVYDRTAKEPFIIGMDIWGGMDDGTISLYNKRVVGSSSSEKNLFTVSYEDNVEAGTATIVMQGEGNFTGEYRYTFDIEPADINDTTFEITSTEQELMYQGSPVIPKINLFFTDATGFVDQIFEGEDYTLEYKDNEAEGTGYIVVKGIGNFSGTMEIPFEIGPYEPGKRGEEIQMTDVSVDVNESFVFNGNKKEPVPAVTYVYENQETGVRIPYTLVEGKDFEIAGYNDTNINAGTAEVIVNGLGVFVGTNSGDFVISPADISVAALEAVANQTYTGSAISPDLSLSYNGMNLVKGTDYSVSYSNNENVGTANVSISGLGNYSGTTSTTFTIDAKLLSDDDISTSTVDAQLCRGSAITPEPEVSYNGTVLVKDKDYTLSYENNVNVGTATINIAFIGNYSGSASTTFQIVPRTISDADVANGNIVITDIPAETYSGAAIKPEPKVSLDGVELVKDKDYSLSYENNVNAGTAKVNIAFIGNFVGSVAKSFVINPKSGDLITIAPIGDKVFTGNPIMPDIEATDN